MSPAEAEKWIVDLILDSKLVAKIDSRDNYVEMDTQSPSVYQQVLDRTERLASLTYRLSFDTQKLLGQHSAYPQDNYRRGGGGGGGRGGGGGGGRGGGDGGDGEDGGSRRAQGLRGDGPSRRGGWSN